MTLKSFFCDLISPRGNFGRVQFILGECYRGAFLGVCYLLYLVNLKVLALMLFPFALWIGIVATIKRFNDLQLSSVYILFSLIVISTGFGVAWQLQSWPWLFIGIGPYLLWVCLTPGKK